MLLNTVYPGGVPQWELLWLQNVVFVFIQFTTGAALYTDDDRYLGPLSTLGDLILRRTGRDTMVTLHLAGGLVLVATNVAFVSSWYAWQPIGPLELLSTRPAVGWTTLVLTVTIGGMALFGLSMYGEFRPNTWIPTPAFGYTRSRKIHRGLFAVLVAVVGYHVFLTPRIALVWTDWLRSTNPFGVLVLAIIAVWGLLAGQVVLMLGDWATGRLVSGQGIDARVVSLGGAAFAVALAVGQTVTAVAPPLLSGAVLLAAAVTGVAGWRLAGLNG